jgi:hypothetical protein
VRERVEMGRHQRRLGEVDPRLIDAITPEPADGGPTEARRFAIAQEQAEGKRVGE